MLETTAMPPDPQRIQQVFLSALALPEAGARAAYLDKACAKDADLRGRVEALLAAHGGKDSLLDSSAVEEDVTREYPPQPEGTHAPATCEHIPTEGPGVVIAGRYTLEHKLGEGGMGEVWVAKQTEPIKRRVALKLIKAGMDSKAVVQRFEQERQALAVMDHPNIAKVLDGGVVGHVSHVSSGERHVGNVSHAGRPYFVMELVNGLSVTAFCDEAKLTPQERLELFVPICQAVQHAHQKGIIHRDLKPSNILVTMIDGKPVPKVIDFGVAKAVTGKLTDESLATQFGAVLGTLEYMAPEQAGYSGQDVDTRADIYSLGVILYELLTGLRPFDSERLRKGALDEILRILREEEPPRPSTRISTSHQLPTLASVRRTEPRKLTALVKGDLDWIVMKCLEKDRNRRYETANQMAADLQRFLADEPVLASPPTVGYRLRKYVRRHRAQVLVALLLLGALLAGLAGTTWGLIEAQQQREDALTAQGEEAKQRGMAQRERDEKEKARQAEAAARWKADAERKTAESERATAIKERDARQREAQRADGLRLAAEARVAVHADPALALCLAIEATRRHRHHLTFRAYYEALGELREERLYAAGDNYHAAGFSPDGRRAWALRHQAHELDSTGTYTSLTVHDADTGQQLGQWPGVPLTVTQIAASPDGKWLAIIHSGTVTVSFTDGREPTKATYTGQVVHLVDAATGRGVRNLGRHDDEIVSVQFSPDSRRLLTASMDKTARLWDVATGAELSCLKGHLLSLHMALFSPDGQRVLTITAGANQTRVARQPAGDIGKKLQVLAKNDPLAWMFADTPGDTPKAWLLTQPDHPAVLVDPVVTDRPADSVGSSSYGSYATGTDSMLAGLWDATTGKCLATFTRTQVPLSANSSLWRPTAAAFSPDGKRVILAFDNGETLLWDAATGEDTKAAFVGYKGLIHDMTFSPDGTRVATAGHDASVRLWDVATGKELLRLRGHQGAVQAVRFDKAGKRLLTRSSEDKSARVWDVATGMQLVYLRGNGPFHDAIFSPEETHVLTAGAYSVSLWSLAPLPGPERVVTAHREELKAITYSPDGLRLLTASHDGTAKLFDTTTGRLLHILGIFPTHGPMRSACFSPDGKLIVTASQVLPYRAATPWSVHVWDATTGEPRFQLSTPGTGALHAAFTPDGQRLVTVDDGSRIQHGAILSTTASSSEKAGQVRFWNVADQRLLHTMPGLTVDVPRFSVDGRRLFLRPKVAGDALDNTMQGGMLVYDGVTLKETARFGFPTTPQPGQPEVFIPAETYAPREDSVALSPDGRRMVTSTWNSSVLWDTNAGKPVAVIHKGNRMKTAAFSRDNRFLAVTEGTKAYILDAQTGHRLKTLTGHEGAITAITFNPDGTQVLTGAEDQTAARWQVETGKLEAVYMGHQEAVTFVAFRPDGKQVATAVASGQVRLWPLDPVADVSLRAPRHLTDPERQRYEVPGVLGK